MRTRVRVDSRGGRVASKSRPDEISRDSPDVVAYGTCVCVCERAPPLLPSSPWRPPPRARYWPLYPEMRTLTPRDGAGDASFVRRQTVPFVKRFRASQISNDNVSAARRVLTWPESAEFGIHVVELELPTTRYTLYVTKSWTCPPQLRSTTSFHP